jgi:hypothetical protein
MDKKQIRQYWKELYQRSLDETLASLDIKGERVKLIIQLVFGGLILGIVSGFSFLGIKGYQNFYDTILALVVGTVVTAVAIFIGLAWGARFIARWNVFRVAVVRDYEQKRERDLQKKTIARLNKRIKSKTINTGKIKFTPKDEPALDYKGYYYVYLEVLNGENYDLRNCYANLEILKIRYSDSEEWINWLEWRRGNTNELTWPAFRSEDEKVIRRTKTARINIAKMKAEDYPIFMFIDGREERMPANQIYIEVSLNGELHKGGKFIPIEEIDFHGFMKYEKGWYVQEGATITTHIGDKVIKETEPSVTLPEVKFWIEPGEVDNKKEDLT